MKKKLKNSFIVFFIFVHVFLFSNKTFANLDEWVNGISDKGQNLATTSFVERDINLVMVVDLLTKSFQKNKALGLRRFLGIKRGQSFELKPGRPQDIGDGNYITEYIVSIKNRRGKIVSEETVSIVFTKEGSKEQGKLTTIHKQLKDREILDVRESLGCFCVKGSIDRDKLVEDVKVEKQSGDVFIENELNTDKEFFRTLFDINPDSIEEWRIEEIKDSEEVRDFKEQKWRIKYKQQGVLDFVEREFTIAYTNLPATVSKGFNEYFYESTQSDSSKKLYLDERLDGKLPFLIPSAGIRFFCYVEKEIEEAPVLPAIFATVKLDSFVELEEGDYDRSLGNLSKIGDIAEELKRRKLAPDFLTADIGRFKVVKNIKLKNRVELLFNREGVFEFVFNITYVKEKGFFKKALVEKSKYARGIYCPEGMLESVKADLIAKGYKLEDISIPMQIEGEDKGDYIFIKASEKEISAEEKILEKKSKKRNSFVGFVNFLRGQEEQKIKGFKVLLELDDMYTRLKQIEEKTEITEADRVFIADILKNRDLTFVALTSISKDEFDFKQITELGVKEFDKRRVVANVKEEGLNVFKGMISYLEQKYPQDIESDVIETGEKLMPLPDISLFLTKLNQKGFLKKRKDIKRFGVEIARLRASLGETVGKADKTRTQIIELEDSLRFYGSITNIIRLNYLTIRNRFWESSFVKRIASKGFLNERKIQRVSKFEGRINFEYLQSVVAEYETNIGVAIAREDTIKFKEYLQAKRAVDILSKNKQAFSTMFNKADEQEAAQIYAILVSLKTDFADIGSYHRELHDKINRRLDVCREKGKVFTKDAREEFNSFIEELDESEKIGLDEYAELLAYLYYSFEQTKTPVTLDLKDIKIPELKLKQELALKEANIEIADINEIDDILNFIKNFISAHEGVSKGIRDNLQRIKEKAVEKKTSIITSSIKSIKMSLSEEVITQSNIQVFLKQCRGFDITVLSNAEKLGLSNLEKRLQKKLLQVSVEEKEIEKVQRNLIIIKNSLTEIPVELGDERTGFIENLRAQYEQVLQNLSPQIQARGLQIIHSVNLAIANEELKNIRDELVLIQSSVDELRDTSNIQKAQRRIDVLQSQFDMIDQAEWRTIDKQDIQGVLDVIQRNIIDLNKDIAVKDIECAKEGLILSANRLQQKRQLQLDGESIEIQELQILKRSFDTERAIFRSKYQIVIGLGAVFNKAEIDSIVKSTKAIEVEIAKPLLQDLYEDLSILEGVSSEEIRIFKQDFSKKKENLEQIVYFLDSSQKRELAAEIKKNSDKFVEIELDILDKFLMNANKIPDMSMLKSLRSLGTIFISENFRSLEGNLKTESLGKVKKDILKYVHLSLVNIASLLEGFTLDDAIGIENIENKKQELKKIKNKLDNVKVFLTPKEKAKVNFFIQAIEEEFTKKSLDILVLFLNQENLSEDQILGFEQEFNTILEKLELTNREWSDRKKELDDLVRLKRLELLRSNFMLGIDLVNQTELKNLRGSFFELVQEIPEQELLLDYSIRQEIKTFIAKEDLRPIVARLNKRKLSNQDLLDIKAQIVDITKDLSEEDKKNLIVELGIEETIDEILEENIRDLIQKIIQLDYEKDNISVLIKLSGELDRVGRLGGIEEANLPKLGKKIVNVEVSLKALGKIDEKPTSIQREYIYTVCNSLMVQESIEFLLKFVKNTELEELKIAEDKIAVVFIEKQDQVEKEFELKEKLERIFTGESTFTEKAKTLADSLDSSIAIENYLRIINRIYPKDKAKRTLLMAGLFICAVNQEQRQGLILSESVEFSEIMSLKFVESFFEQIQITDNDVLEIIQGLNPVDQKTLFIKEGSIRDFEVMQLFLNSYKNFKKGKFSRSIIDLSRNIDDRLAREMKESLRSLGTGEMPYINKGLVLLVNRISEVIDLREDFEMVMSGADNVENLEKKIDENIESFDENSFIKNNLLLARVFVVLQKRYKQDISFEQKEEYRKEALEIWNRINLFYIKDLLLIFDIKDRLGQLLGIEVNEIDIQNQLKVEKSERAEEARQEFIEKQGTDESSSILEIKQRLREEKELDLKTEEKEKIQQRMKQEVSTRLTSIMKELSEKEELTKEDILALQYNLNYLLDIAKQLGIKVKDIQKRLNFKKILTKLDEETVTSVEIFDFKLTQIVMINRFVERFNLQIDEPLDFSSQSEIVTQQLDFTKEIYSKLESFVGKDLETTVKDLKELSPEYIVDNIIYLVNRLSEHTGIDNKIFRFALVKVFFDTNNYGKLDYLLKDFTEKEIEDSLRMILEIPVSQKVSDKSFDIRIQEERKKILFVKRIADIRPEIIFLKTLSQNTIIGGADEGLEMSGVVDDEYVKTGLVLLAQNMETRGNVFELMIDSGLSSVGMNSEIRKRIEKAVEAVEKRDAREIRNSQVYITEQINNIEVRMKDLAQDLDKESEEYKKLKQEKDLLVSNLNLIRMFLDLRENFIKNGNISSTIAVSFYSARKAGDIFKRLDTGKVITNLLFSQLKLFSTQISLDEKEISDSFFDITDKLNKYVIPQEIKEVFLELREKRVIRNKDLFEEQLRKADKFLEQRKGLATITDRRICADVSLGLVSACLYRSAVLKQESEVNLRQKEELLKQSEELKAYAYNTYWSGVGGGILSQFLVDEGLNLDFIVKEMDEQYVSERIVPYVSEQEVSDIDILDIDDIAMRMETVNSAYSGQIEVFDQAVERSNLMKQFQDLCKGIYGDPDRAPMKFTQIDVLESKIKDAINIIVRDAGKARRDEKRSMERGILPQRISVQRAYDCLQSMKTLIEAVNPEVKISGENNKDLAESIMKNLDLKLIITELSDIQEKLIPAISALVKQSDMDVYESERDKKASLLGIEKSETIILNNPSLQGVFGKISYYSKIALMKSSLSRFLVELRDVKGIMEVPTGAEMVARLSGAMADKTRELERRAKKIRSREQEVEEKVVKKTVAQDRIPTFTRTIEEIKERITLILEQELPAQDRVPGVILDVSKEELLQRRLSNFINSKYRELETKLVLPIDGSVSEKIKESREELRDILGLKTESYSREAGMRSVVAGSNVKIYTGKDDISVVENFAVKTKNIRYILDEGVVKIKERREDELELTTEQIKTAEDIRIVLQEFYANGLLSVESFAIRDIVIDVANSMNGLAKFMYENIQEIDPFIEAIDDVENKLSIDGNTILFNSSIVYRPNVLRLVSIKESLRREDKRLAEKAEQEGQYYNQLTEEELEKATRLHFARMYPASEVDLIAEIEEMYDLEDLSDKFTVRTQQQVDFLEQSKKYTVEQIAGFRERIARGEVITVEGLKAGLIASIRDTYALFSDDIFMRKLGEKETASFNTPRVILDVLESPEISQGLISQLTESNRANNAIASAA
jgi:hypothetical protein